MSIVESILSVEKMAPRETWIANALRSLVKTERKLLFHAWTNPHSIKLLGSTFQSLTTQYGILRSQRTTARLISSDGLPKNVAMSGWSHGKSNTINVAGFNGTQKALKICEHLGFVLEPGRFSGGIPEQFNACHAEK